MLTSAIRGTPVPRAAALSLPLSSPIHCPLARPCSSFPSPLQFHLPLLPYHFPYFPLFQRLNQRLKPKTVKDVRKTIGYFLSFSILIFPFTFLGRNPSSQLFLCTLHFISPLKQLKVLLITTTTTTSYYDMTVIIIDKYKLKCQLIFFSFLTLSSFFIRVDVDKK